MAEQLAGRLVAVQQCLQLRVTQIGKPLQQRTFRGQRAWGGAATLGRGSIEQRHPEPRVVQCRQAAEQALGRPHALPEDPPVAAAVRPDHAVRQPNGGRGRARFGALDAVDPDRRLGLAVKHHRRAERDRIAERRVAVAQRAGGIRDVAALVRIDGDAVGLAERLVLRADVVAHRHRRDQVRAARPVAIAQHRPEIAAPSRIGMDGEVQAAGPEARAQIEQAAQRIDRALLGAADHRDHAQDRGAPPQQIGERDFDMVQVQTRIAVDALHEAGVLAEAEQRRRFRPGVVSRCRHQEHRWLRQIRHEAAVETDQADILQRVSGQRFRRRVGRDVEPGERRGQPGQRVEVEIEQRPSIEIDEPRALTAPERNLQRARRRQQRHLADRSPQADAGIFQVPRRPQRLDVGDGAAAGDVPPADERARIQRRSGVRVRVGCVAQHAAQIVADLDLEPRGDRRSLGGDVVLVVQPGGELPDRRRQRLVPQHVTLVAHAGEGRGQTQFVEQIMSFAPQPIHAGRIFGRRAHFRSHVAGVFGVERAAELGVAADRGDDQLDEDAGVFRAGAEEPGLRRAVAGPGERERRVQLLVPRSAGAGAPRRDFRHRRIGRAHEITDFVGIEGEWWESRQAPTPVRHCRSRVSGNSVPRRASRPDA